MVTGLNIIGQNKALQDHQVKRIVAIIIDSIILFAVVFVLSIVALPLWWATGGFGGFFWGPSFLLWALFAFLYFVVQDAFMGGTIGKRVMGLRVVGTTGNVDIVKSFIRNLSKVHFLVLFLDWIVGLATEGDPRQKLTDRWSGTTVVRTDQHAYVEEQFRQMATPPPHPTPPSYAWGQAQAPPPPAASGASPPGPVAQPPPAQSWPGQGTAGGGWPQHRWDEQGNVIQAPRFCSACGTSLVARGDGKMTCPVDGSVY